MTKNDVRLILQVKEFIDANLNKNISLQDLSDKFLLNRSKLQSGFQELFDTSVYAYIVWQRMEWAANRIRTTDDPIKVIALDIGYKKQRSFNKSFKGIFQFTPSAYRRMHQSTPTGVQ